MGVGGARSLVPMSGEPSSSAHQAGADGALRERPRAYHRVNLDRALRRVKRSPYPVIDLDADAERVVLYELFKIP